MKKVYLLFALLVSLMLINVVHAEGPYFLETTSEQKSGLAFENVSFKDGYLLFDLSIDSSGISTTVYKLDKNGKLVQTEVLESIMVTEAKEIDNKVYLMYVTWDRQPEVNQNVIYFGYFNDDLTITHKVPLDSTRMIMRFMNSQMDTIYYYKNKIRILYEGTVASINKDLTGITYEDASLDNFPNYEIEGVLDFGSKAFSTFANHDNGFLFGYIKKEGSCVQFAPGAVQENDECQLIGHVEFYKGTDLIIDIELPKGYYPVEERIMGDHIVVSALTVVKNGDNPAEAKDSTLFIFDKAGNKVQEIKAERFFERMVETPKGFVISDTSCPFNVMQTIDLPIGMTNDMDTSNCITNHKIYNLYHGIETKVTSGKGNIEVVNKQRPGEPVTFIIKPAKGYVLGEVRVTDADGNVLVLAESTFTMPSADVTIEVVFKPVNPETSDILIGLIGTILGFSLVMILANYKRIKGA